MTALSPAATGSLYALLAYGSWGLLPLYWKALGGVEAPTILAHRVLWSLGFLALLLMMRRTPATLPLDRRALRLLLVSGLLIGGNWLIYIWAVNAGRVLETSLGYFINPLVNVLLGRLFLGERLRPRQRLAVALAALGVAGLAVGAEGVPWVALSLALSFGFYGLLRKLRPVDPLAGLAVETGLMAPLALAWLFLAPAPVGDTGADAALLAGAGIVTALPLIWFAAAAARLRLTTLGFFQYMAPSLHFLLAVFAFGEPVLPVHAFTFGCIWLALALYAQDGWTVARAERAARVG